MKKGKEKKNAPIHCHLCRHPVPSIRTGHYRSFRDLGELRIHLQAQGFREDLIDGIISACATSRKIKHHEKCLEVLFDWKGVYDLPDDVSYETIIDQRRKQWSKRQIVEGIQGIEPEGGYFGPRGETVWFVSGDIEIGIRAVDGRDLSMYFYKDPLLRDPEVITDKRKIAEIVQRLVQSLRRKEDAGVLRSQQEDPCDSASVPA